MLGRCWSICCIWFQKSEWQILTALLKQARHCSSMSNHVAKASYCSERSTWFILWSHIKLQDGFWVRRACTVILFCERVVAISEVKRANEVTKCFFLFNSLPLNFESKSGLQMSWSWHPWRLISNLIYASVFYNERFVAVDMLTHQWSPTEQRFASLPH